MNYKYIIEGCGYPFTHVRYGPKPTSDDLENLLKLFLKFDMRAKDISLIPMIDAFDYEDINKDCIFFLYSTYEMTKEDKAFYCKIFSNIHELNYYFVITSQDVEIKRIAASLVSFL